MPGNHELENLGDGPTLMILRLMAWTGMGAAAAWLCAVATVSCRRSTRPWGCSCRAALLPSYLVAAGWQPPSAGACVPWFPAIRALVMHCRGRRLPAPAIGDRRWAGADAERAVAHPAAGAGAQGGVVGAGGLLRVQAGGARGALCGEEGEDGVLQGTRCWARLVTHLVTAPATRWLQAGCLFLAWRSLPPGRRWRECHVIARCMHACLLCASILELS